MAGSKSAARIIEQWKRATPREFYLSAVERLASWVLFMRVGPGPNSFDHFRETVEMAPICRGDEKFTRKTLAEWGKLDDDEVIVPDVIK